jgi:hypothetical protein
MQVLHSDCDRSLATREKVWLVCWGHKSKGGPPSGYKTEWDPAHDCTIFMCSNPSHLVSKRGPHHGRLGNHTGLLFQSSAAGHVGVGTAAYSTLESA